MNDWRADVEDCVRDFLTVSALARYPIHGNEMTIEYLSAPHVPPTKLPPGQRAVYGFWYNGIWLKIGKAGQRSSARYTSQHYNVQSFPSNFGRSLLADPAMAAFVGTDPARIGDWIKTSTNRVNILLSTSKPPELLSLLEAFLHVRPRPRYEGRRI